MQSPFSSYFVASPSPGYGAGQGQQQQPVAGPSQIAATPATGDRLTPQTQSASQRSSSGVSQNPLDYDYGNYGLDPAAFSTDIAFQMPSFLSGPFAQPPPSAVGPSLMDATMLPFALPNIMANSASQQNDAQRVGAQAKTEPPYTLSLNRPIYGPYGSSIVGVTPDAKPFQPTSKAMSETKSSGKARAAENPPFDPAALGLPRAIGGNFPGLYSVSGFDMLGVLARVAARPNPQINVGPVDLSTAFTVVDARRFDLPIVYASDTFMNLTGYTSSEIIGRNCRFLQAPLSQSVVAGTPRTHTDSNAVYHMKAHIQSGKESQSSVINYRKDGTPFINLVTIIPISWESDEVAYYVGFQVDVIKQPNSILERMKNGTYTVNYSLVQSDRSYADHIAAGSAMVDPPIPQPLGAGVEAALKSAPHQNPPPRNRPGTAGAPVAAVRTEQRLRDLSLTPAEQSPVSSTLALPQTAKTPAGPATSPSPALADMLTGLAQMTPGVSSPQEALLSPSNEMLGSWHQQLLEQCDDLIHVLSLKGTILYMSPSSRRILEYEPSELIGKTVSDVCHPADVVPIMRELKDASNAAPSASRSISILYRIKRKQSDYVWIEAQGRFHLELGKARKSVIFIGRQRPLYSLSRSMLFADGGIGDDEFWAKISFDGMFLHVTPAVESLLGFNAIEMTGFTIYQLTPDNDAANNAIEKALERSRSRLPARVTHELRNYQGAPINVVTSFYPPLNDGEMMQPTYAVCRICTQEAENARHVASVGDSPPGSARDALFAPAARALSENFFEELETSRGASWQFERHALVKSNKAMREEREILDMLLKKPSSVPAPTFSTPTFHTYASVPMDSDDDDVVSDGSAPLQSLPLPSGASSTGPMQRASTASTTDGSMI